MGSSHFAKTYNSSLYERLALSRDKKGVLRLAKEGNVITKPEDIIKQPTGLEWLRKNHSSRAQSKVLILEISVK